MNAGPNTGHVAALPGGMTVRRLLPAAQARAVGPFVFFDHFGPITLQPEAGSDVGGHPHIGLATVTYLFEGAMLHRDSLGTEQLIEPGALNWMHAGSGIVHSERTPPALVGQARRLHGLQLWVALPPDQTQSAPHFQHVAASALPQLKLQDASVRLLVGEALGVRSPVRTAWPTLYIDLQLPPGGQLTLPQLAEQWALYAPEAGLLRADGSHWTHQQMHLLPPEPLHLHAGPEGARAVLIGGAALPQLPRMWWNFVAYDRAELAAAAARWAAGGFEPIPGETDRVPAPPWRD